jgi:hypothetical protein
MFAGLGRRLQQVTTPPPQDDTDWRTGGNSCEAAEDDGLLEGIQDSIDNNILNTQCDPGAADLETTCCGCENFGERTLLLLSYCHVPLSYCVLARLAKFCGSANRSPRRRGVRLNVVRVLQLR